MNNTRIQKFCIMALFLMCFMMLPTATALTNNIIVYQDNFEQLLFNNQTNLTIPTYEGSNQATHPDVVFFSNGWKSYKYWMAMTPYPNASNPIENPSIVVSNDGISWSVPGGLTNPVANGTIGTNGGYDSDTDLVYNDATNQLYLYYIEDNFSPNPATNELKFKSSSDGVTWSSEQTLFTMKHNYMVSPAIVKNGNNWYMWYVNSTDLGSASTSTTVEYRTSLDGLVWSVPATLSESVANRIIWHLNVNYVQSVGEYWMLITAGSGNANANLDLYFGSSKDGLTWTTNPTPIIRRGQSTPKHFDTSEIYRSAMITNGDSVQLWYGAVNTTGVYTNWSIGYATSTLSDISTNYHWEWRTPATSDGIFNLSTDQVHSGTYSARLQYISTGSDIMRNISAPYNVTGLNTTVQVYMYDDGDATAMKQLRVRNESINTGGTIYQNSLGVWTDASAVNYTYKPNAGGYIDTLVPRSNGWHLLRMDYWKDKSLDYYIDGVKVATSVNQFDDVINVVFPTLSYTTVTYFDDFKVTYNNSANDTGIYFGNILNVVNKSGLVSYDRERNATETPINMAVVPSSGSVNVTVLAWSTNDKRFTISSTNNSVTTTQSIDDLSPNTYYYIIVNGISGGQVQTNNTGWITFNYFGGFSQLQQFEITTVAPFSLGSNNIPIYNTFLSVMKLIIILVLVWLILYYLIIRSAAITSSQDAISRVIYLFLAGIFATYIVIVLSGIAGF